MLDKALDALVLRLAIPDPSERDLSSLRGHQPRWPGRRK